MSTENDNLRAIVDIGSNGIRFSISSLDPSQARIIPCLFQDRAAISLFDAQHGTSASTANSNNDTPDQYSTATTPAVSPGAPGIVVDDKQDINAQTMEDVCQALIRFKLICRDFRVPDHRIHVIATEATREAKNSREFRDKIESVTGWKVNLLSKEDEARTGAYGVASSFYEVQGLFMDLGGGSTQLSWIMCKDGKFQMSPSPISLPYGAAALTRRLAREPDQDVFREMRERLSQAVELIQIPDELKQAAEKSGGYKVYMSGGGYRAIGNCILARHETGTYPLPIINGYSCPSDDMKRLVSDILDDRTRITKKSFRISERRALQLPAVALLTAAVIEALPKVRKVLFSQGGVREGALFHELPLDIRAQDPMFVATRPYAPMFANSYVDVLKQGVSKSAPPAIRDRLIYSLVNTAFVHSSYPKELQPSAALAIGSTGVVSGAHGLSHEIRALLGLALCQRWGGELPDRTFRDSLIEIVTPRRLAWWAIYCGHLMHVIGGVYPGGMVHGDSLRLQIKDETTKGFTLVMQVSESSVQTVAPTVRSRIKNLDKKLRRLKREFEDEADALDVKVDLQWI